MWAAQGVYVPTLRTDSADPRSATFNLPPGVAVCGSFADTEESLAARDWTAHASVLSGDIDANDTADAHGVVTVTTGIIGDNAYHVVSTSGLTETARLNGFTLTAGNGWNRLPQFWW